MFIVRVTSAGMTSLVTGIIFLLMMSGCREQFPPYPAENNPHHPPVETSPSHPTGEPPQDSFITFDLPEGWQIDPYHHFRALWPHPGKDHHAPWVLLEFYTLEEAPAETGMSGSGEAGSGQGGANQSGSQGTGGQAGSGPSGSQNSAPLLSAKDKALQDYQYKHAKCLASPACAKRPQADQPQFGALLVGDTTVWYSESQDIYWSEPSWTSLVIFEKGKKVITFLLQDRAEYYPDLFSIIVQSFKTNIDAKGTQPIKPGIYSTLGFDQIPVGNFEGFGQMPVDDSTLIQPFSTSIDAARVCGESKIYGHTGVDLGSQKTGQNLPDAGQTGSNQVGSNPSQDQFQNVYALFPGLVILSQQVSFNTHWGEAMVLATRLSSDSEQILTHHYYHLAYTNSHGRYETSRRFEWSSVVQSGDVIAQIAQIAEITAMDGCPPDAKIPSTDMCAADVCDSGMWTPHVHVGLRLWHNFQELQQAFENNAEELYGPAYVFDSEEKMAEFIDPACAWSNNSGDCWVW